LKRSTFTGLVTAAAFAAPAFVRAAYAADTVTVGTSSSSSDVPLFIAEQNGYFKEQGLDVKLTPFDSAAKMVAPLGTGELDVAAGAPSAGFYNAVLRGVDVKIVADKGSAPKNYGYLKLLVRSDLAKSGKVRSYKDLKGLKLAEPAQATSTSVTVDEALKRGGLTYDDIQHIYMGFPNHVSAFAGKSIDASMTTEPSATLAVRAGDAVQMASCDQLYLNQQIAVILYGGNFIVKRPEVGRRFMIAYIKAARFYNDALAQGHLRGKNGPAVLSILTQYTPLKDRTVYEQATPNGNNPDGRVNVASLQKDLGWFRDHKLVNGDVSIDKVHDGSFVDAALKQLGPYKPAR
jgi:NitT/TauT family transport system substrate-binding protein